MPSLGMYTIEGELTCWLVAEGTQVQEGQPILELTTEKTTVEIEAPSTGILHQVLSEGQLTKVEGLLGYILAPGESAPTVSAAAPTAVAGTTGPTVPPAAKPAIPASSASGPSQAGTPSGVRLRASPVARRRAEELGLDITRIAGTGPGGRIIRADVEGAAASGRRVLRRLPLSGMRGLIAARMHQSLSSTAQLTLIREADAGPLVEARKTLEARADGVKIPFDVLLAKALRK